MMKLDATSVVETDNGILTQVSTYSTFEEAANLFRSILVACTKDHDEPLTEEDIEDCVDNGVWDDESGYTVYLATSECEGEEDEDEETTCSECGHEFAPRDLMNWGDRKVCDDCYDALDAEKADLEELNQ